jgi:hypothetical protein
MLSLAAPVKAADPFTDGQVAGLAVLGAFTYRDYKQTLDIKNHEWAYERNVLMGRCPSDNRIRNYFVGMSLAGLAITYALPSEYRKYAITAGLVLEISATQKNKRLGLRGSF